MTQPDIATEQMIAWLKDDADYHKLSEIPKRWDAVIARLTEFDASEKAWDIKQRQLEEMTTDYDALKAEAERLKTEVQYRWDLQAEALDRAEKAEAEVDKLTRRLQGMSENRDYWEKKSNEAEAEVEQLKKPVALVQLHDALMALTGWLLGIKEVTIEQAQDALGVVYRHAEKAEAELEAARPLLEVINGSGCLGYETNGVPTIIGFDEMSEKAVLAEALAYRENAAKEGK